MDSLLCNVMATTLRSADTAPSSTLMKGPPYPVATVKPRPLAETGKKDDNRPGSQHSMLSVFSISSHCDKGASGRVQRYISMNENLSYFITNASRNLWAAFWIILVLYTAAGTSAKMCFWKFRSRYLSHWLFGKAQSTRVSKTSKILQGPIQKYNATKLLHYSSPGLSVALSRP